MSTFIETTWFLWWLFAAVIVGWWSWRLFADGGIHRFEPPAHWRNLYRQALVERDETKLGIRIQEAEGAILLELTSHVFARNSKERIALQEAMDHLYSLRQAHSDGGDKRRVSA